MNRAGWQQIAEDRLLDAISLLAQGRWSGAYYLAGYALESGLKACIMRHVADTGIIFQDKKFSEKCWVHGLDTLLELANLKPSLEANSAASTTFSGFWGVAKDWKETSRYEQKTQAQAEALHVAITHVEGVMPWIRLHW